MMTPWQVDGDIMVDILWFSPLQTTHAGEGGGTEDTQEGYGGGVCGLPCRGDGCLVRFWAHGLAVIIWVDSGVICGGP